MKRSSHLSLPYRRGPLDPRPFTAVPMKGEQVLRLELSITVTTVLRHKETIELWRAATAYHTKSIPAAVGLSSTGI